MKNTFQTGIHEHTKNNIKDYALFLGGLNVTHDALNQYDPLKTGFGRLFMIRQPIFLTKLIDEKLKKFKHILEYGNTGVSGNDNISVSFNDMTGGYNGRKMEIPNIAQDSADTLTVKTYEFSGSPVREVIQYWINGVTDIQSGYSTYYGLDLDICQANHTAEFIYLVTDQSGREIEYACLWANCFPKEIRLDQFNYDSGTHELVQLDISFTGTRYISPQINDKAAQLNNRFNVLMNSLNFNSGYSDTTLNGVAGIYYDGTDGKLKSKKTDENLDTIYEIDGKGNREVYPPLPKPQNP